MEGLLILFFVLLIQIMFVSEVNSTYLYDEQQYIAAHLRRSGLFKLLHRLNPGIWI